ncbi:hypothetical protein cypCar_00029892 [Cyprinus carpio]|nr:hypothetical protein cypCar_00029892 [Cyprinus carpio]
MSNSHYHLSMEEEIDDLNRSAMLLLLLRQSKYTDLLLPIHPQHSALSMHRQKEVLKKPLEEFLWIPQVIIMTKVDEACPLVNDDLKKVYTSKSVKQKMHLCSEMIGVPMNCIFPVKNCHNEIEVDNDVDVLILKAFDQIENFANDRLREAASN